MGRAPKRLFAAALLAAVIPSGCRREDRAYRPAPPFGGRVRYDEKYGANANALSEGQRLFAAFNCVGCHGRGGGGIGPPLMDETWIYGSHPLVIFDTITGGRPNGMPAFGGVARSPGITVAANVPEYQRWQLVAYVRSLSGLASPDAAPGRGDHMAGPVSQNQEPRPGGPQFPPESLRPDRQSGRKEYGRAEKGAIRVPIGPAMDAVVEAERAKATGRGQGP